MMNLSEGEVEAALQELHSRLLVLQTSGRVMRYATISAKSYQLPGAAVVLLAVLMLGAPRRWANYAPTATASITSPIHLPWKAI